MVFSPLPPISIQKVIPPKCPQLKKIIHHFHNFYTSPNYPLPRLETQFEMEPGATAVSILEFDQSEYLNFEAEVHFPEDEGVLQVEQFGVHVNEHGKGHF